MYSNYLIQWFLINSSDKESKMIKLKTKLSFDFSLERNPQRYVTRVTKSISKLMVVVKEVMKKRLLKS